MRKSLWTNLTQVDNQIILEFPNEGEARDFYDIWTKDNHKNNRSDSSEVDIQLDGLKVILVYRSTEEAKVKAIILIGPYEYHHPLETQGKRCKSCG